jgi:hypothetical protein
LTHESGLIVWWRSIPSSIGTSRPLTGWLPAFDTENTVIDPECDDWRSGLCPCLARCSRWIIVPMAHSARVGERNLRLYLMFFLLRFRGQYVIVQFMLIFRSTGTAKNWHRMDWRFLPLIVVLIPIQQQANEASYVQARRKSGIDKVWSAE